MLRYIHFVWKNKGQAGFNIFSSSLAKHNENFIELDTFDMKKLQTFTGQQTCSNK